MLKVRFPKVDANVVEGQVGMWLKAEGDPVDKDEPLVELITDKANFELPAEQAGVLRRILAPEKSVVPVNYVIGLIGEADEAIPDVTAENEAIMAAHREAAAALQTPTAEDAAQRKRPERKKVRAKPAARRAAREAGIDLADVTPADGKIVTEEDVRAYLSRKESES